MFVEFPAWSGDYKTAWGFNQREADLFPPVYNSKPYQTAFGFGLARASVKPGHSNVLVVSFPHWLPVLVFATSTALLKRESRWRFSIRDLLIFLTGVGIVLSVFAVLDRLAGAQRRAFDQQSIQAVPIDS